MLIQAQIDSIAIVQLIFHVLVFFFIYVYRISGFSLAKNPSCSTPDKPSESEFGSKQAAAGSGLDVVNHKGHSH